MPRLPETDRSRILDAAESRFFSRGYRRTTVDELAADLGMSKKTLYRYFPGKEQLLDAVLERFTRTLASEMDGFLADARLSFPDRAAGLLDALGRRLALLDRHFLEDLHRHAPQLWKRIEAFRRERIFRVFGALFREGVSSGFFRSDLDPELILRIYFESVQNVLNPRTLSALPFSTARVFETLISVLFEGMLTDRGRRLQPLRARKES